MFDDLIEKLHGRRFITLEVTPSKNPNINQLIATIENSKIDKLIDAFIATDNPLAKLKYSALFASIRLQEKFQKPCISTISMRDRNKIALQSDLLGANDFDVRAILALTGDSASISDQPLTKGVFEANSLMLLNIIKSFNSGFDFAGRPFKDVLKQIYPFAVTNAYAKNFHVLQKKIYKKIESGAVGIITQPIFDVAQARVLLDIFYDSANKFHDERKNSQLIFGIFPITKLRTAQFLSSHVPGICVPQKWIDILEHGAQKSLDDEYQQGLILSKNLFDQMQEIHPKLHLMSANRFDIVAKILS